MKCINRFKKLRDRGLDNIIMLIKKDLIKTGRFIDNKKIDKYKIKKYKGVD